MSQHSRTGSENSAGCFTVWLRNLLATRRGPSKKEKEEDEKRKRVLRELNEIYKSVKEDRGDYGDANCLDLHNIKCLELSLAKEVTPRTDTFFIPMTKEKLDQYLPDITHEDTKWIVDNSLLIWEEKSCPEWLKQRNPANSLTDRNCDAQGLCNFMGQRFVAMKRKGPNSNDRTTLRKLAGWNHGKYSGSLVEDRFSQDLFSPTISSLEDPFEASNGRPHVMFYMANGFPSRNDSLYSYEILAILAVMISQFNKPSLQKHKVVPVKVISFSGWDGRILEAHFDSEIWRLIIKVSHLHDFSSAKVAFPNADLFLRHMACKTTGKTEAPKSSMA